MACYLPMFGMRAPINSSEGLSCLRVLRVTHDIETTLAPHAVFTWKAMQSSPVSNLTALDAVYMEFDCLELSQQGDTSFATKEYAYKYLRDLFCGCT